MDAADVPREAQDSAQKEGRSGRSDAYSGRLLLRMPKSLHAALARASEANNLSLNAFINDALEKAVNSERSSRANTAGSGSPAPRKRQRSIDRLLLANLVVVAVVGLLAIALLVQALR